MIKMEEPKKKADIPTLNFYSRAHIYLNSTLKLLFFCDRIKKKVPKKWRMRM